VHKLLGSMASDSQAQSSAITEISAAINEMDRSTQQNAAMVEETSAAARNLSTEVVSLSAQASQFKVDTSAKPGAGSRALTNGQRRPVATQAALQQGAWVRH